ncbi:MAG: hypothetical protein H6Q72_2005 [Firmicutes bacterium]|nr:hypothetical protein [Bacillota bacterium]
MIKKITLLGTLAALFTLANAFAAASPTLEAAVSQLSPATTRYTADSSVKVDHEKSEKKCCKDSDENE